MYIVIAGFLAVEFIMSWSPTFIDDTKGPRSAPREGRTGARRGSIFCSSLRLGSISDFCIKLSRKCEAFLPWLWLRSDSWSSSDSMCFFFRSSSRSVYSLISSWSRLSRSFSLMTCSKCCATMLGLRPSRIRIGLKTEWFDWIKPLRCCVSVIMFSISTLPTNLIFP